MTVESGSRLANRYRLEEQHHDEDGLTTWRAMDEILRRSVGVHLLTNDDPRRAAVLAAVQASAKVSDPRFVQILDASEENGVTYVVQEWPTDAAPLADVVRERPLTPRDAVRLLMDVAQAIAAAHAAGLFHRRLSPTTVLRTGTGQAKIVGLEIDAALHGTTDDEPTAADTMALGKLLFAALTGHWPGQATAGLPSARLDADRVPVPSHFAPGIPPELDDLTIRILAEQPPHGAPPLRSPREIVAALSMIPRGSLRQPTEPTNTATALLGRPPTAPTGRVAPNTAPPLGVGAAAGGGTGPTDALAGPSRSRGSRPVWYGIGALVVAGALALGLTLFNGNGNGNNAKGGNPTATNTAPAAVPLAIQGGSAIYQVAKGQSGSFPHPEYIAKAYDGDPNTAWLTLDYKNYPKFGNLLDGAGIVVDLGQVKTVSKVQVTLPDAGTGIELLAAPDSMTAASNTISQYTEAAANPAAGGTVTLTPNGGSVHSRFIVVWLTSLPQGSDGEYRSGISEIQVFGS